MLGLVKAATGAQAGTGALGAWLGGVWSSGAWGSARSRRGHAAQVAPVPPVCGEATPVAAPVNPL